MIVTCEECSTSFQLDEARIPATGAQVRCSRCKHAFFLPSPTASESEAVHAVASEAAATPEASVPSTTADLDAASATELASPSEVPEPDLEEEDWQFSEEVRVEGDDPDEASGSVFGEGLDSDLGLESDFGESSDFSGELDQAGLQEDTSAGLAEESEAPGPSIADQAMADVGESSGLELDSGPEPAAPVRDESSFGSVDDFSELMEDDTDDSAADLAAEIASEMEAEAAAQAAPASTYAERGTTDDLGDPESWDLIGSDDFATDKSANQAAQRSMAAAALSQGVSAEDFFSGDGLDDTSFEETSAGLAFLMGPGSVVGRTLGWLATVGLVGAIFVMSIQSEGARWAEAPIGAVAGPLRAETTGAGWVETTRAGPVLRFAGELRNTGNQRVWPGVVQLLLLDAKGNRLTVPPIAAGIPLAEEALRESAPEVLIATRETASQRLGASPLAPGEVRPFEAILLQDRLPETARRVLLEVGEPAVSARTPRSLDTEEAEVAGENAASEPAAVVAPEANQAGAAAVVGTEASQRGAESDPSP